MSSTGNRSQPNQTRVAGRPAEEPQPGQAPARPGATHQENRDHNKHNRANPDNPNHKPEPHAPAEEKR